MADKQWPERGQMSEDGKYYTHTDGRLVVIKKTEYCLTCFLRSECDCGRLFVTCRYAALSVVEGPYVPSADERVAEAAMRAHIIVCAGWTGVPCDGGGDADIQCDMFKNRTCHLRRYLADVIRDPKAWEV